MRNTYEVRAEKFIHQVFDYISGCECPEEYEHAIDCFNQRFHRRVHVANGLTRVTMITSDYVVKVDCGTDYNLDAFGSCDTEIALYQEAERDGFAYLFAKPTPVVYRGITFCIMPRIYGIGKYWADADVYMTEEENDWVSERVFDLHNGNYGWRNDRPVIFDYAAVRE